MQAI
jgi:WD40 repeat protein